MENLTIGQIALAVAFLVGLITGISYLHSHLKAWINQALKDRFDGVENRLTDLEGKLDEMELKRNRFRADSARRNILNFNDELLRHLSHSKESFDQCLRDIDAYEHYCSIDEGYQNNQALFAIGNIKRCYKKCVEESTFLS